jgi:hypothetical protein
MQVQLMKFIDLHEQDEDVRKSLQSRFMQLERRMKADGPLPPDLEAERHELKKSTATKRGKAPHAQLKYQEPVVEPLFIATQRFLEQAISNFGPVKLTDNAQLDVADPDVTTLMAVYGLLKSDSITPTFEPRRLNEKTHEYEPAEPDKRFGASATRALVRYNNNKPLFEETLKHIADAGGGSVDAGRWARVTTTLLEQNVPADSSNLPLLVNRALANTLAADGDAPAMNIEIDLPDIDGDAEGEIIPSNLRAMQALYFASMLEGANFFDTGDKIEELFINQMLPLGRGPGGEKIYRRWKNSTQRISKAERLSLYARAFGFPGGDPTLASQNREFSDLWLRFISAVSEYTRKLTVDDLLRSRTPISVSGEQVRKAGRDLAANLSLHGYGIAYFAATELQNQINEILDILRDSEVLAAYGSRDWRQVVDQVSVFELGGAKNVVRASTMANAGAVVMRWLAENSTRLSGPYQPTILDPDQLRKPSLRPSGVKATVAPTDRDLVDACEQWLAVTGTSDQQVENYAQPSEAPTMTSRPVSMPQFAKDMLDSVGISAGYTNGGRRVAR